MHELTTAYQKTISRRRLLLGAATFGGAGLATLTGLSLASAAEDEVLRAARFAISIDGREIASFKSIEGLISEQEVIEYIETDRGEAVLKKLPGKRSPPTVTLKRGSSTSSSSGQTNNIEMWTWHEAARLSEKGGILNATLTLENLEGKPIARYNLTDAWPSKFELGTLRAASSEVEIETVTLIAARIERIRL